MIRRLVRSSTNALFQIQEEQRQLIHASNILENPNKDIEEVKKTHQNVQRLIPPLKPQAGKSLDFTLASLALAIIGSVFLVVSEVRENFEIPKEGKPFIYSSIGLLFASASILYSKSKRLNDLEDKLIRVERGLTSVIQKSEDDSTSLPHSKEDLIGEDASIAPVEEDLEPPDELLSMYEFDFEDLPTIEEPKQEKTNLEHPH